MRIDAGMQVWKFEIPVGDFVQISMPFGAELLHFATQGAEEKPCVWALVDPTARTCKRRFRLIGTGHQFRGVGHGEYVGTIHIKGGALVFHLFDLGTVSDAS